MRGENVLYTRNSGQFFHRFNSFFRIHIDHFNELLSSGRGIAVGKNMDFLAQELFREANTVNSKTQDMKIVKYVLAVKGEIESIRQQVQNLE